MTFIAEISIFHLLINKTTKRKFSQVLFAINLPNLIQEQLQLTMMVNAVTITLIETNDN